MGDILINMQNKLNKMLHFRLQPARSVMVTLPPRSHGTKAELPYTPQMMVSTALQSLKHHVDFHSVTCCLSASALVDVKNRLTVNSNGLYSVHSELYLTVVKEDIDAQFYCEVTYFVPGAEKMIESKRINITVHCKKFLIYFSELMINRT